MLADDIPSPNPQTSRLNDFDLDAIQQGEALMFLIHFLGDIHQPLHTENMDRGDTHIPACFDRDCSDMNLHSVWDTKIPNKHRGVARHSGLPRRKGRRRKKQRRVGPKTRMPLIKPKDWQYRKSAATSKIPKAVC
jgi:S1/P1 Nuclease